MKKVSVSSKWQPPCCGPKIALSARELSVNEHSDRYILGIQKEGKKWSRKRRFGRTVPPEEQGMFGKQYPSLIPPRDQQTFLEMRILRENEARKVGETSPFPPLALGGLWKAMTRYKTHWTERSPFVIENKHTCMHRIFSPSSGGVEAFEATACHCMILIYTSRRVSPGVCAVQNVGCSLDVLAFSILISETGLILSGTVSQFRCLSDEKEKQSHIQQR